MEQMTRDVAAEETTTKQRQEAATEPRSRRLAAMAFADPAPDTIKDGAADLLSVWFPYWFNGLPHGFL